MALKRSQQHRRHRCCRYIIVHDENAVPQHWGGGAVRRLAAAPVGLGGDWFRTFANARPRGLKRAPIKVLRTSR